MDSVDFHSSKQNYLSLEAKFGAQNGAERVLILLTGICVHYAHRFLTELLSFVATI